MALTPLNIPPSRTDPANFAARSDALFVALPQFVAEVNALQLANNLQAASVLDQSVKAKDAAVQAWAASMAPAETLPAISKSLHFGAIVKNFFYDTSRDSDGGAWRKRCTDKSWYTEAINGLWLGQSATAAMAWALAGAVTGAYFQNTTDGKFYVLGAASPAVTETVRGNVREFPAQVAIVAEAGRVVIYDLTQVSTPMWMVFPLSAVLSFVTTSVFMIQGDLLVTNTNGTYRAGFIADYTDWRQAGNFRSNGAIAKRTTNQPIAKAGAYQANDISNDVCAIILPDAPIDPATGLPIPTVAVATNGGVSIIKSDGTVANWLTAHGAIYVATLDINGRIFACGGAGVYFKVWFKNSLPIGSADNSVDYLFNQSSIPARLGDDNNNGQILKQCALGNGGKAFGSGAFMSVLTILKDNPASPIKGMLANITNAFNTGWQVGDSRGCWLASTIAETLISTDLVTNGAFSANVASWIVGSGAGATVAWNAGSAAADCATGTTQNELIRQTLTTVAGASYNVSASILASNMSTAVGVSGGSIGAGTYLTGVGTRTFSFVATSTTCTLIVYAASSSGTATIDNISCKLADPDRSVKNNGLVVNGSITKAPVAAGAALVGYSGFSGANFFTQPATSNLDFGTGDFGVMGWMKSGTYRTLFNRTEGGAATGTRSIVVNLDSTGRVSLTVTNNVGTVTTCVGTSTFADGSWLHMTAIRRAGVLEVYANGVLQATIACVYDLTSTTATCFIGLLLFGGTGTDFALGIALLRIGATAPSLDQIAHIYRTELALFQPSAKGTLDGTSSTVTALEYDDVTDTLHVGTSWGRSVFRDLLRTESEISTVGAITSLAAHQGAIITGGASSGRYYQPAMLLRDELRRRDEARQALGQIPVYMPDVGVTSKTAFTMQIGYRVVAVYAAGLLKDAGATLDYTLAFDGFRWTITFAVAPANGARINFVLVRS